MKGAVPALTLFIGVRPPAAPSNKSAGLLEPGASRRETGARPGEGRGGSRPGQSRAGSRGAEGRHWASAAEHPARLCYLLLGARELGDAALGTAASRESAALSSPPAATAARGTSWTLSGTMCGRGRPPSSYSSRSRVWSALGTGCWRVRLGGLWCCWRAKDWSLPRGGRTGQSHVPGKRVGSGLGTGRGRWRGHRLARGGRGSRDKTRVVVAAPHKLRPACKLCADAGRCRGRARSLLREGRVHP